MFINKYFERKPSFLEETVESLMHEMSTLDGDSDAYTKRADNLVKLYKLLEEEKTNSQKKSLSPDTVVLVLGNLLGIVMIVKHEQTDILTSKAMAFLGKLPK